MLTTALLLLALAGPATRPTTAPADDYPPTTENVGHERHLHPHNPPHPRSPDAARFHTSRPDALQLPLPHEEDAFVFAVFGDRTGGPDDGVAVLADAVRDVNLIEPDFVITVGDLIQGYNERPEWLAQMREYKGVMGQLICPWFPVAGNHDIYWRDRDDSGDAKPEGEHEDAYEVHFGPLWYAFEHKDSWFIVLYSDEGDPATGEKNFNKPESHAMSPEQKQWLAETLGKAEDARHVFVFLHHPRWTGGPKYGQSWDQVHEMLVEAGNVTAVFAGHIHRMRYEGPRDGIEYVTLATTGGGNGQRVPEAGMLHHYHLVTVRKQQTAMAAVPVGGVLDVREITAPLAADAESLATMQVEVKPEIELASDGSADATVTASFVNPAALPVDVELVPESRDSRWRFTPDHAHMKVGPGEPASFTFRAERMGDSLDAAYRPPALLVRADMLAPATRYTIPERRVAINGYPPAEWRPEPAGDLVLQLDGGGAARVANRMIDLPDGPLTVETWLNAAEFGRRVGVVCKTQGSEYGMFANGGRPHFSVHVGGRYVTAEAGRPLLEPSRWHHVAGVFDGREVRLYVDGELVAAQEGSGPRKTNGLPLYVGADVDGGAAPTSFFKGRLDGVRISSRAVYEGQSFDPPARPEAGDDTALLLDMDASLGPWLYGAKDGVRAELVGGAQLMPRD